MLTLAIYGFFAWEYARQNFNGNLSGFLHIGTKTIHCPEAWYPGLYLREDEGFDGEFTYYLALDPFLKKELYRCTLADGYRYQRILLPWITAAVGMGHREWYPGIILFMNMIALISGTYFLILLCDHYGTPRWASLFFPVSIGPLVVFSRCTNELLCASLVLAALYFYLTKRDFLIMGVFLSLAVLAKEVALASVAGITLYEIAVRKNRRILHWMLLPGLSFSIWQIYLFRIFGKFSLHQTNLSQEFAVYYPFQGLIEKLTDLCANLDVQGLAAQLKIYILVEPILVVSIFISIALLLHSFKNFKNPIPWVAFFYLILLHVGQSVPPNGNDVYGFGRHSIELFGCILLLYIIDKKKIYLLPLWINSAMTCIKYYTLIKS